MTLPREGELVRVLAHDAHGTVAIPFPVVFTLHPAKP